MAVCDIDEQKGIWIFGYGSLIWKPGFDYVEARSAILPGYERCFCQASHDHRGTPESPGRVVTLRPKAGARCAGMAFLLEACNASTLRYLDEREQDGYDRVTVDLMFANGVCCAGLTWIASEGNSSWRGGEAEEEVAKLIARSIGPSGSNSEYLFQLEHALRRLGVQDPGITKLADLVRAQQEFAFK